MPTDLIRYDLLVQDALRGVVRSILTEAAREGLPGEHHFFISFRTQAPGVKLSNRLRDQYPEEMTIVLQHQFWDLVVGDLGFEVGLSFHGKSEILAIPFAAVTGFFDPTVDFGLKFEFDTEGAAQPGPAERPSSQAPALVDKSKPRGSGSEPLEVGPTKAQSDAARPQGSDNKSTIQPANESQKVVSIDAFRKKP
ncbi:MAG TPA: ClpXP protease specificity-enhancing factor SspB [Methylovirgula sp.]